MSFDTLSDSLGDKREEYPLTCYAVSGSQSAKGQQNHVIVIKMSNLHRTSKPKSDEDAEESDSESDEDEDSKPELETALVKHAGCVNRIRVKHQFYKNSFLKYMNLNISVSFFGILLLGFFLPLKILILILKFHLIRQQLLVRSMWQPHGQRKAKYTSGT